MSIVRGVTIEQFVRQPWGDDKSHHQRDQHTGRGVDRNRAHIRAHQAGHKRHRHQRGDDGEGRQNGRATDFINGYRNHFQQFLAAHMQVTVDVFHHHDGVVDQNTNGENQREQRYTVEGKAPHPAGKQGDRQGNKNCTADDHRLAPAHGCQYQHHHGGSSKQQFGDQFVRFIFGGNAVIAGDFGADISRNQAVMQIIEALLNRLSDINGVHARLLGNGQGNGRV